MKKIAALVLSLAATLAAVGAPAAARASSVTDAYAYHQQSTRITVDYSCDMQFNATVDDNAPGFYWIRYDATIDQMEAEMNALGVTLTDKARAHLEADYAATAC